MIVYGLSTLPLLRSLLGKGDTEIDWRKIWYVDDSGIMGRYKYIKDIYAELTRVGPRWGYFPEPSKSILVVGEGQMEGSKDFISTSPFL